MVYFSNFCIRVGGAVAPGVSLRSLTADPRVSFTRQTHTHTHTHTRALASTSETPNNDISSNLVRCMKGRAATHFGCFLSCAVLIIRPSGPLKFAVQEGNLICKESSCLSAKGLRRLNSNIRIIRKFANIRFTHKLCTMQTCAWEVTFYWIWIPRSSVAKDSNHLARAAN